ncbi:MAG TPA: tRNA (guanosine(37)-N1)-methyltransferase TrmD [Parachlamydiaceae bacterium]|nr:tRNA (guanosine(37)-N1)-methyltransferase TrmD [Parachlamydiaceae bacterium]
MLKVDILSLFPGYFCSPFDESIFKQAKKKELLQINLVDIRDYSDNRHRKVDDRPFGGGPGMVLMPEPVSAAIKSVKAPNSRVIYLTPQGATFTAAKAKELAQYEHLVLLCGHYEGIDQRVLDKEVDEEISIGDFVLTNGCLAAIVVLDAVIRWVPNVLGDALSASEDSFENGLLDCPQFTRPEVFDGVAVPDVLQSGNHKKIAEWRKAAAVEKTRRIRPDLLLQLKEGTL